MRNTFLKKTNKMQTYKYSYLIRKHGKPLLLFSPKGDFTQEEIEDNCIPNRVAVFKLDKKGSGGCFICARYNTEVNQWHINQGSRFAVSELLRMVNNLKTNKL